MTTNKDLFMGESHSLRHRVAMHEQICLLTRRIEALEAAMGVGYGVPTSAVEELTRKEREDVSNEQT